MEINLFIKFVPVILLLSACSSQEPEFDSKSFDELTSTIRLLEESNRNQFKEVFTRSDYQLNMFQLRTLEMYEEIDKVVHELLYASGSYNDQGELFGGRNKVIGKNILEKRNLFRKIESKKLAINESIDSELREAMLLDIASTVYVIQRLETQDLEEMTVAQIYFDLVVTQNRLLVAMLKYEKRCEHSHPN